MAWCITCSCWYTYKSPSGLCTGCKFKEDARYVEPEIPIVEEIERRGRHKGNRATNPITLYLRENGSSLKEWCKDNNEDYKTVGTVIARSRVHKRIQRKLEDQGLWELLEG